MQGAEPRQEGTDGSTERPSGRGRIRAYAPPGPMRRPVVAWAAQYAHGTGARLELLVDEAPAHPGPAASRADRLERAAAGACLLVVPQLLPEVAEIVDRAYAPVVVVPEDDPPGEKGPVVVALAGRTGDEVLDAAFAEAARVRAPLLALRVREAAPLHATEEEAVQADAEERRAWEDHLSLWYVLHPDVRVTVRLADGDPVDVLTEQSCRSRLLVLGRSGRGRLLGALRASPVAELARTASCAVLVVPPPGPPHRSWWPRSR